MNWNFFIAAVFILFVVYFFIIPRLSADKNDYNPEISYNLTQEGALLIDVRGKEEYNSGHIANAVNIPHSTISQKTDLLKTLTNNNLSKPIVVYCASGRRSSLAKQELKKLGYLKVINHGSLSSWKK